MHIYEYSSIPPLCACDLVKRKKAKPISADSVVVMAREEGDLFSMDQINDEKEKGFFCSMCVIIFYGLVFVSRL